VVEDDVVMVRRFRSLVARAAAEMTDRPWAMIALGYLGDTSPIASSPIARVTSHVAEADGWEVLGAHCLAIRGAAIPAVLENMEVRLRPGGHRIHVDGIYNEFRRDESEPTYICLPNLAHQGPSPSGITEVSSFKNDLLGHERIRRGVEVIKRFGWDVGGHVPPSVVERYWNARASRRSS